MKFHEAQRLYRRTLKALRAALPQCDFKEFPNHVKSHMYTTTPITVVSIGVYEASK